MTAKDFVERFREATTAISGNHVPVLPGQLLNTWKSFVSYCEAGYDFDISEYDYDLGVRDYIESVLNSELLRDCEEMGWFREQVEEIDQQFRGLLQPRRFNTHGETPWWKQYVLRYAGAELAQDFFVKYGVDVELSHG
jgi:hypothetical protein